MFCHKPLLVRALFIFNLLFPALSFAKAEFSCRALFENKQVVDRSIADFDDVIKPKGNSFAVLYPAIYQEIVELIKATPSYHTFVVDKINQGTPLKEILRDTIAGRNQMSNDLKNIAGRISEDGSDQKLTDLKRLILKIARGAEVKDPEVYSEQNWYQQNDWRRFISLMDFLADKYFNAENVEAMARIDGFGSKVYSLTSELLVALSVPNFQSYSVRFSEHPDFGYNDRMLSRLHHDELDAELDVVWTMGTNGSTRYQWGEVKSFLTPLDIKQRGKFQHLVKQLARQERIAHKLGVNVDLHLFLMNGLTFSAYKNLSNRGFAVHGEIKDNRLN